MPARLESHRNDRIAAMRFEPARFSHGRSRCNDLCAGRLDAIEQRFIWQSEMKAHDLGFKVFDQRAKFGIEGTTDGTRWRDFRIKAMLDVVRSEPCSPREIARGIGFRGRGAK